MKPMENLEVLAKELQDLNTEYSRLNWAKYTTGLDFGVNDAYEHIVDFLKNNHHWDTIQGCKESETDSESLEAKCWISTESLFRFSDM